MLERSIRGIAGTVTVTSLALGYFVHPAWFILTAFVGLNLLQSSVTRWCFMEDILRGTVFRHQNETMRKN